MRRIKLLPIILLLSIITAITGCQKWLDVSTQTSVKETTLFQNEQGFKDALTGVYISLASRSAYGQNLSMGFMSALGQQYNSITATTHNFYQATKYNYTDGNTQTNYVNTIWASLYTSIANLNNILGQIDSKSSVFDPGDFNLIKGEALGLRALLHFDLLRCFGAAPVVDSLRKSIPYVTHFGTNVFPLLSVNDVMDSCIRDLNSASQLLANETTVRAGYSDPFRAYTRNHFNYWATQALLARIYLYRGNKANALAAALKIINDPNVTTNFPFVTSLQASNTTGNRYRSFQTEQIFTIYASSITDYVNDYFKFLNISSYLYSTSTPLGTLYETTTGGSTDLRYNYQFENTSGSGLSTSKYNQDGYSILSSSLLPCAIPVIRLSEMYFIAAECAATPDVGVTYLNSIRTNRALAALPTTITPTTLTAEILKEYKKEMYAEGQLFYYFKRKNTTLVDGSTTVMSDATWIFPFPPNEIAFSNRK